MVWVKERSVSEQHFIHEGTERPPIDGVVVSGSHYHFGSEVRRSTADRVGDLVIFDLLGEVEISQVHIAITVDQNVFRFDISVKNVMGMEIT